MNASQKNNNISLVTSKLFGLILKMPLEERRRLLTQVERKQQGQNNDIRREYERQDYLINIDYTVKDRLYKGFAINLSAGGIFIESSKSAMPDFTPGDHVILSFDHPNKQEHMKISGDVARVDKKGIGIKFDQAIIDWWTV